MEKPEIKPHWGWYFLGPGLMLLGAVTAVAIWLSALLGGPTGFPEWRLAHGESVNVTRSGEYTVYLRESRDLDAEAFKESYSYHLEPAGGGNAIRLEEYTGSDGFTLAGAQWRAVYRLNVPTPGRYDVVGGPSVGRGTPPAVDQAHRVRVGDYPAFLLSRIFTFAGIVICSIFLCLVCTIVVALRRRANLRRAQAMSPP